MGIRARLCALAIGVATIAGANAAGAQRKEIAYLNAVMQFRAFVVRDTTRFDACSVYNAVGRPADFPAGFDRSVLPLLDRTVNPCGADSTRVAVRWPPRFVRVERVVVAPEANGPHVVLAVRKYEYSYREAFRVNPVGTRANVSEVRTYGILQSLPIPPNRRVPNLSPE
ncbi:MAG TPA: hypothetical protein VF092_18370 [Longimicrobium sp.]